MQRSLSARRAWIEMSALHRQCLPGEVALRKESVDRNLSGAVIRPDVGLSLSARRAWIEIQSFQTQQPEGFVALRKESMECFSF